jgi:phosphoglycolate phosphatase-like HAD superfamily hydrolase
MPIQPRTLLLWDIDGTILHSGSAGEAALKDSMREKFGLPPDLTGIELAGRTDKLIAMNVLKKFGLPTTLENVTLFVDGYLESLAKQLPERRAQGYIFAGVVEILEAVRNRPDLAQGLLTGNVEAGARLKLEQYDVHHYFAFGGFADDHHDRNALPPFAKSRAEQYHGVEFPPERIFVIGDTSHDIACGQAIGAKTIGVATGNYSVQDLLNAGATASFADFSDTAAFFAVVDAV